MPRHALMVFAPLPFPFEGNKYRVTSLPPLGISVWQLQLQLGEQLSRPTGSDNLSPLVGHVLPTEIHYKRRGASP